ncbi:MAG: acyl-CoA dehydrogenase [Gemmatimonadales bacterium]|nr:MAG: acyl-CoA dehydrogenase [Gemmatimonadales bacterium]
MTVLNEEQVEIRALAREFAQGELRPHTEAWDAARALPDSVFEAVAEIGFLGLRSPEAHGGLGLDLPTALLAVEALAWGESSVGLSVAIHVGSVTRAILTAGTEAQQGRWLPELASGARLGAFALSEIEAGSDVGAVALHAERVDGGWKLSGEKRWVTNGERAGLLLVFARTGPESGVAGLSVFLVEGGSEGLRVTGRERTLGMCASQTVTLAFDDVQVPDDALLGEEGGGWDVARDALVHGRLFVAAQALGIAQAAQEHALRYAAEREQFGRSLDAFGGIQEKLAGMAIRIAQARAFMLETAARVDAAGADLGAGEGGLHQPASLEAAAAMAKVTASEAAMWVADEAVQIFGGYGYMRDYPVEKLMRDAKGTEIYEGTNEVLRWIISRELVREAAGG